ncbi:MAG TPA: polysaccharide biosynthesis/export family protein [Rhodanobacteraceae bacterium]|nr:polysaccharide biosynthesis/export family protein [Rhodanobacteraceae bacterium]
MRRLHATRFGTAWILLAALVASGCASTPPATGQPHPVAVPTAQSPAFPPPDGSTPGGAGSISDYRVGPDDLLQISVFQVDELSREVRVNSRGFISLPLIGAIHAGGKTVRELETGIAKRLADGYVRNPQVSVFVKEFTSQRVTVEGAVNKPGIYPLTGRTTLLQVIALAQGFNDVADEEGVVVFRVIDGTKMAALFDIRRIRHGEMVDPQIYGDDMVVVDRSGGRSFLKSVTQTLRGFVGFRPVGY